MVKIIAFPSLRGAKNDRKEPADRADDPPMVSATADGNVIVTQLDRDRRGRGDWDNQELADLYRVEWLLVQANIRVSTARGLSDEGDPWFVFCRDDGEVFVHLARIDGGYILDSPGLDEVLEGQDFPELISRFVSQVAARAAARADNVVTLRPRMLHDQTIRLHPAVMLGALIWSLYVASDDFVGMAHAMEDMEGGADAAPGPLDLATSALALAPDVALGQLNSALDQQVQSYGAPESAGGAGLPDAGKGHVVADTRSASTGSAGSLSLGQGIAASLAAIAIGYGFFQMPEEFGLSGDEEEVAAGPDIDGVMAAFTHDVGHEDEWTSERSVAAARDLPSDHAGDQVEVAELNIDVAMLAHDVTVDDQAIIVQVSAAGDVEVSSDTDVPVETDAPSPGRAAARAVDKQAASPAPATAAAPEVSTSGHGSPAVVDLASVSDSQLVLSLVDGYVGRVADYQLGDVLVVSSLDKSELETVLPRIQIEEGEDEPENVIAIEVPPSAEPSEPHPISSKPTYTFPHLAQYDDRARDFVTHFIKQAGQIELVQFDSYIVLVDMTAIDEATDVAYTLQWVTEDGSVISTIGHLHHFLEYGIA